MEINDHLSASAFKQILPSILSSSPPATSHKMQGVHSILKNKTSFMNFQVMNFKFYVSEFCDF